MLSRGGALKSNGEIAVENPINGMSIEIVDFEKLGCKPANYGTGYFCNYKSTTRLKAFSNERSSAGRDHANAVNVLLGFMNGGKNTSTEAGISRFMKSKSGWVVSEK